MKHFVPLLLLILSVLTLKGQSCVYTIEGRVLDLHDNTPIFGAIIKIEGSDLFGQTDEQGYYKINQVCFGQAKLVVSHISCDPIDRTVTIRSDVKLNFELEHHINELSEIIISDDGLNQVNSSVNESQLNADQLTRLSNQNLAETLNSIAGVSSLKTGSSIAKPMIHGLFGTRVAIIANGMRMQDQEWGADHAPNVDLNGFESVQVVKGAAALKYAGDTAGGMILLSPERINLKDSLYGSTVLNGVDNGKGGSINTRLTRSFDNGYFISGHLNTKQFGDRQAPEYNLTNTGLKETSLGFRLGRTKILKGWEVNYRHFQNSTGILRSAHIGNIEDLLRALESNGPLRIEPFDYVINSPKQEAIHQNFKATYFNQYSDRSKLKLDYNYQISNRKEFDVRRGNRSAKAAIDLTLKTHDFLGSIQWKKDFEWNFEWGVNALLQDNFSNPETGVKRLIPDHQKYQAGTFLTGNYRPSNNFSWEWGFRFDQVIIDAQKFYDTSNWISREYNIRYAEFEQKDFGTQILTNPRLNFSNISAQTGFAVGIGESVETTFSYMLTQRAPNVSELFSDGLHHSLASIEYGFIGLQKETSHKLILGINTQNKFLSIGIDPYLNRVSNFIFIEPSGVELTIRGAFPVWEYQATDVLMWGWDAYAKINLSENLKYNVNAAYTYAQDILDAKPLISVPPFSLFQQLSYTFPKSELEIEMAHRFTAIQSRFPDTNFRVNRIESGVIVQKEVDISTPPEGYHNFDLYFSLPLAKSNFKSTLRLIVQNLTNASYNDYLNRLRFYSTEIGRAVQLQLVFNY